MMPRHLDLCCGGSLAGLGDDSTSRSSYNGFT